MSKIKYINVNKHVIAGNKRHDRNEPPISVRATKSGVAKYAHEVSINGPSRVVYRPDKPLKCGARMWIETVASVSLIDADGQVFDLVR